MSTSASAACDVAGATAAVSGGRPGTAARAALLVLCIASGAATPVCQALSELANLHEALAGSGPADADPDLAQLDPKQRSFVAAGRILYRSLVALVEGRAEEARSLREQFRDLVPFGADEMFRGRLARVGEMS